MVVMVFVIDITYTTVALDARRVIPISTKQHAAFLHVLFDEQESCHNVHTDGFFRSKWKRDVVLALIRGCKS